MPRLMAQEARRAEVEGSATLFERLEKPWRCQRCRDSLGLKAEGGVA